MRTHMMSGGRYPVLRSLAILYLLGAAVMALAGIGTVIWSLVGPNLPMTDRLVMAGAALAGTFFLVITMLAVAELLKLAIDVEHNTRMAHGNGNNVAAPDKAGGRLHQLLEGEETAEGALLRGH